MVNHSSTPNMEKVIEGETLYLQAIRAITAGEELSFCYSAYARERFGLE
jgi:SET domain-containing protein